MKLILVIKWGFVYNLNNILLKKPTVHAQLNRSVGPYIEDMLQSFDSGLGFCPYSIKEKHNTIFVQYSNFMRSN